MDSREMLPCPFCGSLRLRVRGMPNDISYVHCDRCKADGPLALGGAAVRKWNCGVLPRVSADATAGRDPQARLEPTETVDSPEWYTSGGVETIEKVEAVVEGLPAREAYLLGQVVRYVDRAGMKDEAAIDLGKANNYAHRLVGGKWRDHE